jgi:hypothetical protein
MAHDTTILNGDVGVYYFSNNRTKMMYWVGGTNDSYTMNELYSAMQTLLDEATTIDDGSAFSAETPVEYTIGKIDSGDNDPWYITFDLMERITGGALRTSGWDRVTGTNTGIVVVAVSSTAQTITDADRGNDITNGSTSDAGTLLEVIDDGGSTHYLIIRPDSSAAANDFDGTVGSLTCNGNTATTITAGAVDGEMIWANIYSIGTIETDVHLYVYRGERLTTDASDRVYSVNSTTLDYWSQGHIDICVPIKDFTTAAFPTIDDGYLRVYGRRAGAYYASFEVANSITSGGRNPVPLGTSPDIDQTHGIRKISTGSWTGTFVDGEVIEQATTNGRGIIDLTNSTEDSEIVYFPIAEDTTGGALTAMADTYVISGASASATASSGPSADGPADTGWFTGSGVPTIAFAAATQDIDNDGTDEHYGITIDCNQNSLAEVYQWMKWICQYTQGDTDTIEAAEDGVYGEEYEGATAYFGYSAISGTIAEGESVTQATSGATGVIISHDTTNDVVLLRSTRGTFNASNQIDADDDSDYFTPDEASNFAFVATSPLGTFAGGTMFGARGVLLSDYKSTEENSFQLVDIEGTIRERPLSISIEITNLVGTDETTDDDDNAGIFRLTGDGGDVEKDTYSCVGGEAIGSTAIALDTTIATDEPGKTTGGTIILVDVSDGNKEYRIRYSSWLDDDITLANIDVTNADAATTTTVTESGAFTNAKRGDLVYNHDRTAVSYVKTVDSANQITIYPAISGQTTGDHVELNCVPVLIDTADTVFFTLMARYATSSEESVAITYSSPIYYRVKVRNTRAAEEIKPFTVNDSTSGTDKSHAVIRTEDTIIT